MLSGKYDLSKLEKDTPEQLFERYPIATLEEIKDDLVQNISTKRLELRQLVGGKYRDLLKVADDIISMNKMTSSLNTRISDLTFKSSTYDDKTLKNLCAFDDHARKIQRNNVQGRNRAIVFRNIIHDCVYTYYHLEDDVRSQEGKNNLKHSDRGGTELLDGQLIKSRFSNKISLEYLQLSKQIYLLFNLFDKEVNDPSRQNLFSVKEIKSLRNDLIKEIQAKLESLADTYNYEYATNILASYVILTEYEPKEALIWFLEIRKNKLFQVGFCSNFTSSLSYLYVTLSCVSYFKTRLSSTLNRQFHSSTNSNWVAKSCFKKWYRWLNIDFANFAVDFPLSSKQLSINWNDEKLQKFLLEWKESITLETTGEFGKAFANCESLEKMSLLLSDILNSFKMFSSLIELPCVIHAKESKISEVLLVLWRERFEILLNNEWTKFDGILNEAVIAFNNENNLESNSTSYGIDLFTNTDISDINAFVKSASDPIAGTGLGAEIEEGIQNFIGNARAIIQSLTNLKDIIDRTERPIFSIDDSEEPEFWKKVQKSMFEYVDGYAANLVKRVNSSVEAFFKEIREIVHGDESYGPERSMILIRGISQVGKSLDLPLIYNEVGKITHSKVACIKLETTSLTSPLLSECMIPAISKLTDQEIAELTKMAKERWTIGYSNDEGNSEADSDNDNMDNVDVPEASIWKSYETKRKLPTAPSVDLEKSLYKIATSLLTVQQNDFSDIYLISEFEGPKEDLIGKIARAIGEGISVDNRQRDCHELALLTFSDIVFVYYFTHPQADSTDLDNSLQKSEQLFKYVKELYEANPDLQDDKYRLEIINSIRKHFETNKLMYYPF